MVGAKGEVASLALLPSASGSSSECLGAPELRTGRHDHTVRFSIAALLALLPPGVAIAFVKATSSPRDANVGGALFLALGVVVGLTLAGVFLARSSCARR